MGVAGDCMVRCCTRLNDIPAALLCVSLFLIQTAVMDYYLVANLSLNHLAWIGPDFVNVTLLIITIFNSYSALHRRNGRDKSFFSLAWVSWFLMSVFVSAKFIVVFSTFATDLREDDPSFFGPNTFKTVIALGSCVFFLLLTTQHDAPVGSERRRYIEELTGTVVFDILDTVDILEILFEADKLSTFWNGLKEFILAVATLNLLIPTVPLITLYKTRFGHDKLEKWLIYLHKLLVVLAVNVPNLLVRFILWHVFSVAVSPFTLKNVMLISMTLFEFYQHKKEKFEEHEEEHFEMKSRTDIHANEETNSRIRLQTPDEPIKKNDERSDSIAEFSVEDRVMTDV